MKQVQRRAQISWRVRRGRGASRFFISLVLRYSVLHFVLVRCLIEAYFHRSSPRAGHGSWYLTSTCNNACRPATVVHACLWNGSITWREFPIHSSAQRAGCSNKAVCVSCCSLKSYLLQLLIQLMMKISWSATRFRVFLSNYVRFWTILERFQGVHRLAFAHAYPSRASG